MGEPPVIKRMKIFKSCSSPVSAFVEKVFLHPQSSEGAQGGEGALKQQEIGAAHAPRSLNSDFQGTQIWGWRKVLFSMNSTDINKPSTARTALTCLVSLKNRGSVTGRAFRALGAQGAAWKDLCCGWELQKGPGEHLSR